MNTAVQSRLGRPIVLTGALIALLGLLAFLQYRWVGQVSVAERERLEASLRTATQELGEDLYRELARVGIGFGQGPPDSDTDLAGQLDRHYDFWQTTAPYPGLIGDIYVAVPGPEDALALQRFNPASRLLDEADWPETLVELRRRVEDLRASPRPGFDLMWTRRGRGGLDVEEIDDSIWLLLPGGGRFSPPEGRQGPPGLPEWTLVAIDVDYLRTEVLPSIIGAHFDPEEYLVGIFRSDRLLFANADNIATHDIADPDARGAVVTPFSDRRGRDRVGRSGIRSGALFTVVGAPWQLWVKHRSGSLDTAVMTARKRNLAVGFGILALLGVSGALTIVWAERARSLARLQMEFAAGMSHELRTPLATIRMAAHNISSGVVEDPEKVKEYAAMVQSEGRRLSSMVEQVIQFAQTESGRRRYSLNPLSIEQAIEGALTTTFSNPKEAAERVRVKVHPGTSPVLADETALTHALANLLVNALKYGVRADAGHNEAIEVDVSEEKSSGQVRVRVSDHGPGIDAGDIPHIFEPYYRGRDTGPIPGSGLGLSLVRKMMEGMGGEVYLTESTGQGATFELRLPAASTNERGTE